MGAVKHRMMEEESRGYSEYREHYICPSCVDDIYLSKLLNDNLTDNNCNYCGATKAADFNLLLEKVYRVITTHFSRPVDEMSYNSREGGYIGSPVYDTNDLSYELGLENDSVWQDIVRMINEFEWCKKEPYLLDENQKLKSAWDSFSTIVKHKSHFMFFKDVPNEPEYEFTHPDYMNPVDILEHIGQTINNQGLQYVLRKNSSIYRVRVDDLTEPINSIEHITAPSIEYANQPNRMSPAGIPMFYGALAKDTAVLETFDKSRSDNKKVVCGEFSVLKDLILVDLASIPKTKSLFAPDAYLNEHIKFMKNFIFDISKPIFRTKAPHVEYIPTQVITEYLRRVFKFPNGTSPDGLVYRSSKNNGLAVVLFNWSHESKYGDEDAILSLNSLAEINIKEAHSISDKYPPKSNRSIEKMERLLRL